MKTLSHWAKTNRKITLPLVIFLHLILSIWYFYFGIFLFSEKIILPSVLLYVAAGIFLTAYSFYPIQNKQSGIYRPTYFKQKFFQAVVMLSVAIFMTLAGNHVSRAAMANDNRTINFSAQQIALDIQKKSTVKKKQSRKELRKIRRKFRKQMRKTVRKMRKAKKKMTAVGKLFFLLLMIIVAVILLGLTIGLAVNLSYAAPEALGLLIVIGGAGLIIWLFVRLWRKYIEGEGKKKAPTPSEELG